MEAKGGVDETSNGNSILLYHNHQSFYSQKVVFALVEKNLDFQSHIVQLSKFEQYEPWYMRLNPHGEVPVLKDGVKVIPDSTRIIDYLEDNFSNGETPRLLPEKGTAEANKVQKFREAIDKIPIEDLTVGCVLHPHATKLPKFIISRMKALRLRRFAVLEEMGMKYPDFMQQYQTKLSFLKSNKEKQESKEVLERTLITLDKLFDSVETELEPHKEEEDYWLCSKKFTVADISLSVLLHRLAMLGLADRFWRKDLRPNLAKYFDKIQQLHSYKQACLTISTYDKVLYAMEMLKQRMPFILGTVVLFAALAVGVVYYKKYK